MSVSSVNSNYSAGTLGEEVDERGNLKDFVVYDEESSESSTYDVKATASKKRKQKQTAQLFSEGMGKRQVKVAGPLKEEDLAFSEEHICHELGSGLDSFGSQNIIGRTAECHRILSMILQPEGGIRPLLLAPAGTGKHSIVKKVAELLKTSFKDHPLGNRKVCCIDCNDLRAASVAENVTEVVHEKLFRIIEGTIRTEKTPPVFYFRHIEKILHLDHVTEYLQSVLKRPYPFIASISEEAKSETVIKAQAILSSYNFTSLPIEESSIDDTVEIVSNHLASHRLHPNLAFTKEAINLGVRLSVKYEHERPLPIKAINLIQECSNTVLMRGALSGQPEGKILITPKEIADVVSRKTKVPSLDLLDDCVFNQERFIERLKSKVVGQDHAITIVSDRVAAYKMNLLDNKKPWGVFLFVGPTGVGKTELARSLAKILFDDETHLIFINGSEYIEDYTVSNLIGSPKGYEGNESGGLLTEPLKKNPHQVVILDEFEKAHSNVQKLFLQVFDTGTLYDRKGDAVDCSQALFIMTSNVGSDILSDAAGHGGISQEEVIQKMIPLLKTAFTPELVGRFKRGIVPFQSLTKEMMPEVADVKLQSIKERLLKAAEIDLSWTPELVQHFVESDVDLEFGMREFCNQIDKAVVSIIKDLILQTKIRVTGKLTVNYNKDLKQFDLQLNR